LCDHRDGLFRHGSRTGVFDPDNCERARRALGRVIDDGGLGSEIGLTVPPGDRGHGAAVYQRDVVCSEA
jgi:hypothetical protein